MKMWLQCGYIQLNCNHKSIHAPVSTAMLGCSGRILIYQPGIGMKARIGLETMIEPHNLVHFARLTTYDIGSASLAHRPPLLLNYPLYPMNIIQKIVG